MTNEPVDLSKAQWLIIIRHGDRWDYENKALWNDHATSRKGDPPLSALGHEQARETGVYLNKFFQKQNIAAEDITWLSSPFVRCLQTSTMALNAMTFEGANKIPIHQEDGIWELDGKGGKLHADLPPKQERIHYFPRLLYTETYKSIMVPTLPEPLSKFHDRCQDFMDAFHQRHAYKPKTVFVLTTHAAACVGLSAKACTAGSLEYVSPAGPCSVYQMYRFDDSTKWNLGPHDAPDSKNGYLGHISDMGVNTFPWNNFGDKHVHEGYTGPPTHRFAPESVKAELNKE